MASDTRPDDPLSARWSRFVTERLGIEHRHSRRTTGLVVALALACGLYAGWLLADLAPRWVTLPVVALAGGAFLYARPTRVDAVATGLYSLAALVALTPVVLDLAFVLDAGSHGVGNPWAFVLTPADLVALLVFGLFALVPAGIAFVVRRRAR